VIWKYFKKEKNVWMMNDTQWWLNKNILLQNHQSFFDSIYIFWWKISAKFIKIYINKIIVLDNLNKKIVDKYIKTPVFIVRSWLNKEKFQYNNKYIDLKNKNIQFLCTSIFSRHRRYEDVINALSIIKNNWYNNFSLDIIWDKNWDINYYNKIVELVNTNNLNSNVNFLWKVSEKVLMQKYNESDIFLYPNSPQTWWLAVFEAICSWCVTIITKWCWAHEILTNNVNSIIIDDKSPKLFAEKIMLLINNCDLYNNIRRDWYNYVINNISWENYSNSVENIFKFDLKWK
jgi:glycosyltransferase involved in cell wall biosynthesis